MQIAKNYKLPKNKLTVIRNYSVVSSHKIFAIELALKTFASGTQFFSFANFVISFMIYSSEFKKLFTFYKIDHPEFFQFKFFIIY